MMYRLYRKGAFWTYDKNKWAYREKNKDKLASTKNLSYFCNKLSFKQINNREWKNQE